MLNILLCSTCCFRVGPEVQAPAADLVPEPHSALSPLQRCSLSTLDSQAAGSCGAFPTTRASSRSGKLFNVECFICATWTQAISQEIFDALQHYNPPSQEVLLQSSHTSLLFAHVADLRCLSIQADEAAASLLFFATAWLTQAALNTQVLQVMCSKQSWSTVLGRTRGYRGNAIGRSALS